MKRLLLLLPIPIAIASLIILFSDYHREIPKSPRPIKAAAIAKDEFAFPNFPRNSARAIEFDADEATFDQFTLREQDDQRRDWLLFSIMGDCGLTVDEINRALYDVPPIRHGYLRPVARFDYGVTRSCCIGDREIIALIPDSSPEEQRTYLARIFDEHRKNLGQAPKRLHVFTYSLAAGSTATVTRQETLPGDIFFDEAHGYHEATVASQAALEEFLQKTDDLVFAQVSGDGLLLAGRKLPNAAARNVTVEDVAAIWQAEQKIHESWSAIENKWKERWADFDAQWKQREREFNAKRRGPAFERSLRNQTFAQLQAEYDAAAQKLQNDQAEEISHTRLVRSSGFSLDPSTDFEGLAAALAEPRFAKLAEGAGYPAGEMERSLMTAVLLAKAAEEDPAPLVKFARAVFKGTSQEVLKLVGVDLAKFKAAARQINEEATNVAIGGSPFDIDAQKAIVPLLEIIEDLKGQKDPSAHLVAEVLNDVNEKHRFQAARYDGPLNGTQVGMTLFYTDLLAKLWALDFLGHTPSGVVEDFEPMTRVSVSPVFRAELIKLPSTRLWFGYEDNGFQITRQQSMYFARNATRIYAASKNPLLPGQEVPPNAKSEAFLGWWNDHYEEVARFEPQYQRLNEIMKWSLLIGWLNQTNEGHKLNFLASLPVGHQAWFPDWAKSTGDLKFSEWDKVGFYPRDYKGSTTEAMPILSSLPYRSVGDTAVWHLSGGVSLASKDIFRSRAALVEDLNPSALRSGLDYGKVTRGADEIVTLRGTRYAFEKGSPGVATLKSVGDVKAFKFRGRYGELASGDFERTISRDGAVTRIGTRTTGGEIGSFESVPLPSKNGLQIGWRSRGIDNGYAFGRRISSAGDDLVGVLKTDATVESAAQLGDDFFVKQIGSREWMKFSKQKKPSPDVPNGWQSQMAEIAPRARNINLAWCEPGKLPPQLFQEGHWVRGPPLEPPAAGGGKAFPDGGADGRVPPDFFPQKAKDILASPQDYRQRIDAQWREALPKIDQLQDGNEIAQARGMLDDLIRDYGPRSELISRQKFLSEVKTIDDKLGARQFDDAMAAITTALETHPGNEGLLIRKAVAEIAAGRKASAASTFNALPHGHEDIFLREIVGRMRTARIEGDAEALRDFAALTDWRRHLTKDGSTDELVADVKDGRLTGTLRMSEKPGGETVTKISKYDDASIYYQSSLTNTDWSGVPSGKALDELVPQGKFVRLPRGDIAHFLPSTIIADGKSFNLAPSSATKAGAGPSVGLATTPRIYYAWNPPSNSNEDDDEDEANYIYLVLDKSASISTNQQM
jgi:hypothetical protein